MGTDIQVSVVIPTYNRAGFLREAIESVLAQTYTNFEIIVVDDGSTDGTQELMTSLYRNVRYLRQENRGPAAARNNGINNAAGEFIAFLDSDDIWLPEMLSKQIARLSLNPAAGLVATGYGLFETGRVMTEMVVLDEDDLADARRGNHYKNFFATSSLMVRKLCLTTVGLLNENLHYAEDWDLLIRLMERYSFEYLPEVLMLYRSHPTNLSTTSLQENMKQWQKVIDMHSSNGNYFNDSILRRKRLSWLYLNQACAQRGNDPHLEETFMLESIRAWPLWFPGRYSFFLKRLGCR
ncbi:MAG: glycosyltransferase [Geobacteraceae bacterium]|nr:glycosyltransferase [Geobacteraceae bacterium]